MSYNQRNTQSVGNSKLVSSTPPGSSGAKMSYHNPFGPAMADKIFDLYEPYEDFYYNDYHQKYEPEGWYQLELPLENLRELEERMRAQIKRFDSAYYKMMVYALQWHYLMEEVEDNPQIKKLFQDLQMIRKLTGSDKV